MAMIAELRTDTSIYFDVVNFSELSEKWIHEVIANEFTDAEENAISLSMLFSHEPLETLGSLADICLRWCKIGDESADISDPDISNSEEVLWTKLDDLDISVKHIQCLIYLLCYRAMSKDASEEDMAIGLGCAKLYFIILKLPGGGAYPVYHPNLFKMCIDCLPAPDFTKDKDLSLRDFEKVNNLYVSTLFSLIPLLKDFHLGNDSDTLEHVIKKLCDLSACEVKVHLKFNINYLQMGQKELQRKFNLSTIVSILAYEAFSAILSTDLNGSKDQNYLLIFSHLNKYISCYKARKSQTVSQKHLVIKDNIVNFVCHNIQTKDFSSEATQNGIKRLCVGVIDKNEIRNTVSAAIITILSNMKSEAQGEMVEWFLLLVDSADSKNRVFALDLFGQILNNTHADVVPGSMLTNDLQKVAIVFAILTRCDDVSPPVRTKALTVLSQNMEFILKFLDKTRDQATFNVEAVDNISDIDLDCNGNHRFFWYNLHSFRERLNEIAAILQRRFEDTNVTARKAALIALENLIVFDQTYVTEENLKYLEFATKDSCIVVRKQVIQTLSVILESYRNNADIQAVWIKCILPLVYDTEKTVQAKALSVLEEQFLQRVFSSKQSDWESAFILLKLISSDEFEALQRPLQKSFSLWKSENKLRSKAIIQLEKYVGSEWEDCIWFYISNFSMYNPIPLEVANLVVDQFEKFNMNGEHPVFMKYLTMIISHVFKNLSSEKSEVVCRVVGNCLNTFTVPIDLIPIYSELLFLIYQHHSVESNFIEFSSSVIKKCKKHLMEIKSTTVFTEPLPEELLTKYFSTIAEFCQLCPSNITENLTSLLKIFSASTQPPKSLAKILSPGLKAHAYAALGKICLQDENLAKDLLQIYAKELLTSNYDVIRSNIVVILLDMCKRYTSSADKYIPLISLCFKDKVFLIRYQTIVLVVNLLQEGYIKWRGPLFFCLLASLVDKNETIQELGRYSFTHLLNDKKKHLFSEHFIDSIFVFNFFPPPDNETVAQTVRDLEKFSMPGERRREERMCLYTFLLKSMDFAEKAYLIKSIGEILTNVAESVYTLNETTECIIRDCFAILTGKEIRSFNLEQFDGIDEATEDEVQQTELITRKVVIINPIIPVIVSLNNFITDPESDLMHDIILFLKEFLHDYKDSLRDMLAIDNILLRQLELEIKNDAEKEQLEKRMEEDKDKNKPTPAEPTQNDPVTLEGIQSIVKKVSSMIVDQDKEDEALSQPPKASSSSAQSASEEGNFIRSTYNLSSTSPAEVAELQRLASTPRVVLTAVQAPLSSTILNISAIENLDEPMNIDESKDE